MTLLITTNITVLCTYGLYWIAYYYKYYGALHLVVPIAASPPDIYSTDAAK
jgi:hypothetical protein